MRRPAFDPAPRRTLAKKIVIAGAMVCVVVWIVLLVRMLAAILAVG